MTYRFYKVTALVAVEQYEDVDLCDTHKGATRTGIDAVQMISDGDDYLLALTEKELILTTKGDPMVDVFARLRSEVK
jgi:hypothetical protein